MQDSDITFITTTQYTPWLEWSQKSIEKNFPTSPRITVDGRANWPAVWFKWMEQLQTITTPYFILIDEDCFVLNHDEIIKGVEKLVETNSTLAAVPDSFFVWRGFNEVALNPFFLIGDRLKLIAALQQVPHWRGLRFRAEYFNTPNYTFPVNVQRVAYEYEPFYCLFWAVLEAKQKLHYFYPYDDYRFSNHHHQLPATNVRISPDSPDMVLHMWYSRQWQDARNVTRYEKLKHFLPTILS